MNAILQRTPQIIAAEINSIKEQTRTILLVNSIDIGRRLEEAKALIEHGEWGEWLKSSVDYSQSTANNLMRIFREYGSDQVSLFGEAKSQALGNLNYTQAVALLGIPGEEREEFVAENNVAEMSTRELEAAIREKNDAIRRAETAEAAAAGTDRLIRERDELERSAKEFEKQAKAAEKLRKAAEADLKQKENELVEARKSTPIEPAVIKETVEKIPDEVQQELEDLRRTAAKAKTTEQELEAFRVKEKAFLRSQAELKYALQFEGVVNGFKGLLGALNEIKATDPDQYDKYKTTVAGLVQKMVSTL